MAWWLTCGCFGSRRRVGEAAGRHIGAADRGPQDHALLHGRPRGPGELPSCGPVWGLPCLASNKAADHQLAGNRSIVHNPLLALWTASDSNDILQVPGYPPFPGQEKHLLAAQITDITCATAVSPAGFFELDPDSEVSAGLDLMTGFRSRSEEWGGDEAREGRPESRSKAKFWSTL
jgi:hypothetical protein